MQRTCLLSVFLLQCSSFLFAFLVCRRDKGRAEPADTFSSHLLVLREAFVAWRYPDRKQSPNSGTYQKGYSDSCLSLPQILPGNVASNLSRKDILSWSVTFLTFLSLSARLSVSGALAFPWSVPAPACCGGASSFHNLRNFPATGWAEAEAGSTPST